MAGTVRRLTRRNARAAGQIGGSAAGTAAAFIAGGPVAGVAVGIVAAVGPILGEVVERKLSAREKFRIEALFDLARPHYEQMANDGCTVRVDGFFESDVTDRSASDEAVEKALLIAGQSYEEHKLEYLARFLARLAFDEQVTPRLANMTLGLAEQLSWTQYVILGMLAQRDWRTIPSFVIGDTKTWEAWGAHAELRDLIVNRGLVAAPPARTELGLSYPDDNFANHRLTAGGLWLAHCLGLKDMSAVAIAAVLGDLQKRSSPYAASD